MRNKGKVHPTPPSPTAGNSFPILKLLPAAILALISVLSLQDRHVLAYMLSRSIRSPNSSFEKQRNGGNHKPPVFDCDCFDCYTWYWFKWDSSPNRELIHLAIEAFEEHAIARKLSKKKGRKRDKMGGRRLSGKCGDCSPERGISSPDFVHGSPVVKDVCEIKETPYGLLKEVAPPATAAKVVVAAVTEIQHKGLARKVLPDVLGLLNSRLWSLWSPNM